MNHIPIRNKVGKLGMTIASEQLNGVGGHGVVCAKKEPPRASESQKLEGFEKITPATASLGPMVFIRVM